MASLCSPQRRTPADDEAFARLLSLIDQEFASLISTMRRYRERLSRHYVQRRRVDLIEGEWDEERSFPKHETTEFSYRLSPDHLAFQETAIDYCLEVVSKAGDQKKDQRLAFWGTLALMRCVGSSPAAQLSARFATVHQTKRSGWSHRFTMQMVTTKTLLMSSLTPILRE